MTEAVVVVSVRMTRVQRAAVVGILVLAGLLFFGLIRSIGPLGEHECLVAETAREMCDSGEWIVPHFAHMPRIRKTPLAYWTVALVADLTGRVDEFSARLPSALAALGTLACILWIARREFGPRAAVVCTFVGATAACLPVYAHGATVEMQLTFWCALCYALFFEAVRRRGGPAGRWWFYLFYAVFGVALLAKFPMAGIVVGVPIALYVLLMVVRRRWTWRDVQAMRIPESFLIVLLVVAPWPLMIWRRAPDWLYQWHTEFLDRFSGELRNTHSKGWREVLYYGGILAGLALPWTLSMPEALASPWLWRYRPQRDSVWLLWSWLVVSAAIISLAAFKRSHYAVPSAVPLILLLGLVIDRFFFDPDAVNPRRVYGLTAAIGVLLFGTVSYELSVLRREMPAACWPVAAGGAVVLAFLWGAGWTYRHGRRVASLLCIGAISLVSLGGIIGWRRAMPDDRPALRDFARRVDAIVPAGDPVFWVGRHEAPIVFYGRGRLVAPRFDDPARLLKLTGGSFPDDSEWFPLIGHLVVERLKQPEPIWLIVRAGDLSVLRSVMRMPGTVAAELRSPGGFEVSLITNRVIAKSGT